MIFGLILSKVAIQNSESGREIIGGPVSGLRGRLSAGTSRTKGGAEDRSGGIVLNQDGAAFAGLQGEILDRRFSWDTATVRRR